MVQATISLSPNLDLEHALRLVRAAGCRVSKPVAVAQHAL